MQFTDTLVVSDGTIGLYANGKRDARVAVIVLQEIFGVNANIRSTVDRFADLGYRAVAPDLYWRKRAGVDLDPGDADSRTAAMELALGCRESITANMADLASLVGDLRKSHRAVAVIGYCLGGWIAFKSWLHLDVNAVVSYYGVGIGDELDEITGQTTPLLMHMGAEDPLNPPAVQAAIGEALAGLSHVSMRVYPGVGHAFARLNGASYVAEAATRADAATFEFLARHLPLA